MEGSATRRGGCPSCVPRLWPVARPHCDCNHLQRGPLGAKWSSSFEAGEKRPPGVRTPLRADARQAALMPRAGTAAAAL